MVTTETMVNSEAVSADWKIVAQFQSSLQRKFGCNDELTETSDDGIQVIERDYEYSDQDEINNESCEGDEPSDSMPELQSSDDDHDLDNSRNVVKLSNSVYGPREQEDYDSGDDSMPGLSGGTSSSDLDSQESK